MFFSCPKTIVTHDGSFHTDDVFAVASLSLLLGGNIKIIRTRNLKGSPLGFLRTPLEISADYIVDVGNVYDAEKNRFDHHQRGTQTGAERTRTNAEVGAGARLNGVSYASFGLVWKHFGAKICGSKEVADVIERKLVLPIDAYDNGEGELKEILSGVFPYTINDMIDGLNPTYSEMAEDKKITDKVFLKIVKMAEELLRGEIKSAKSRFEAEKTLRQSYLESEDKRIIIVDKKMPVEEYFSSYPEPLFIVYQYSDGSWAARAVRTAPRVFESRKLFPESWAGKRDAELAAITGVSDAVFCHNKRFLAIARSRNGALGLAKLALSL